jgi:Tat protein translocase TatB subunit
MLGIGVGELLVVFLVALIAIGPEKLPKVARTIAQLLGQMRRASDDLKTNIMLMNPLDEGGKFSANVKTEEAESEDAKQNPPLSPFMKGEIKNESVARGDEVSHG